MNVYLLIWLHQPGLKKSKLCCGYFKVSMKIYFDFASTLFKDLPDTSSFTAQTLAESKKPVR